MLALRTALLIGLIAFAVLLLQQMPLDVAIYRSVMVTIGALFLAMLAAVFIRIIRGKQPEEEDNEIEQDEDESVGEGQKETENRQKPEIRGNETGDKETQTDEAAV